jgi:hypothetical protein
LQDFYSSFRNLVKHFLQSLSRDGRVSLSIPNAEEISAGDRSAHREKYSSAAVTEKRSCGDLLPEAQDFCATNVAGAKIFQLSVTILFQVFKMQALAYPVSDLFRESFHLLSRLTHQLLSLACLIGI